MLSPTLALRCPHCQHALALADIRGAASCPACGQAHGLPPAVADALALYERAIQQAVTDLVHTAPASAPDAAPAEPAPRPPAAPQVPAYAPAAPGPSARLLAAPVPATSPGGVYPNTLLSMGPAPAPRPPAPEPAPPPPVPAASPAETLEAPISARPVDAAALSGGDVASPGAATAEFVLPGVPTVAREPSERSPAPVSSVSGPEPLSGSIGTPSLSGLATPDTLPGGAVPPSNSSLLSILYNKATTGLAAAPLQVAAVREPSPDQPPAPSTSELVAAVRSALPDRPDTGPELEGRIPAAALVAARRTLLARHADERRREQVREGSLGLFFAAVVCVFLVVAGYWYAAAPIAIVAIVLRLRREERGERLGAEVQRLADALGGQRMPSYDAIAAWFDSLWPAPVSPEAMWTSHMHGAVRCHVHGYAALVDVHMNEKTAGGVVYPPRITAYLAAVWPGRVPSLRASSSDLTQAAQARLTRLRKAGYTVVADAHGGLIMRASEAIAQAARVDITRLPALQVPIGELADLARDLGAEPVPLP